MYDDCGAESQAGLNGINVDRKGTQSRAIQLRCKMLDRRRRVFCQMMERREVSAYQSGHGTERTKKLGSASSVDHSRRALCAAELRYLRVSGDAWWLRVQACAWCG